jgi:hypothetical protein
MYDDDDREEYEIPIEIGKTRYRDEPTRRPER